MSNKLEEKKLRMFVRKYLADNHVKKIEEENN